MNLFQIGLLFSLPIHTYLLTCETGYWSIFIYVYMTGCVKYHVYFSTFVFVWRKRCISRTMMEWLTLKWPATLLWLKPPVCMPTACHLSGMVNFVAPYQTNRKWNLKLYTQKISFNELISNRFAVFVTCAHILTYLWNRLLIGFYLCVYDRVCKVPRVLFNICVCERKLIFFV
jgi:hypothetical protein